MAVQLLGRHIAGCAHRDSSVRQRLGGALRRDGIAGITLGQLGETEIEDLDVAVAGDEDVVRLQITVNYVSAVGGRETVGNLRGVIDGFAPRQVAAFDTAAESFTLEKLGHKKGHAAIVSHVIN